MLSEAGIREYEADNSTWPPEINIDFRGRELEDWLRDHSEAIKSIIHEFGAICFPGSKVNSTGQFQRILQLVLGSELLEYKNCSTPRKQLTGRIYTSTEYPEHEVIPLHNENSYSHSWPLYLGFMCMRAPAEGGATPLVDCRKVYKEIPEEIRNKFERHGVMYRRNYGEVDLSWQEVFGTEEKEKVIEYCESHNIDFKWNTDTWLTTQEIRQASLIHPITEDIVWFNQANLFHISNYPEEFREEILYVLGEDKLPRNCYYGDGSEIELESLKVIREVIDKHTVKRPWRIGDIVIIDNMLCGHGRERFLGPRKVYVGMAQECDGLNYYKGCRPVKPKIV